MPTVTPWLTDVYHVPKAAQLPCPAAFETIGSWYIPQPNFEHLKLIDSTILESFADAGWRGERLTIEIFFAVLEAATNVVQAKGKRLAIRITDSPTWTVVAITGTTLFLVEKALRHARQALEPDARWNCRGRGICLMITYADYVGFTRDGDRIYLGFKKPTKRSSN